MRIARASGSHAIVHHRFPALPSANLEDSDKAPQERVEMG